MFFYYFMFSIFIYSTVKDSKCNAQEFNAKELKEHGKTIVEFKKKYDG